MIASTSPVPRGLLGDFEITETQGTRYSVQGAKKKRTWSGYKKKHSGFNECPRSPDMSPRETGKQQRRTGPPKQREHAYHARSERVESSWWVRRPKATKKSARTAPATEPPLCITKVHPRYNDNCFIITRSACVDRNMNDGHTGPRRLTGATYPDRAMKETPLLGHRFVKR